MSTWARQRLENIFKLEYGKSLVAPKRVSGNYPIYGSSGRVGTHISYLIKGPGIIVGRKGSVGEVYFSKDNFFPIDTVYYISKNDQKYDIRFLYYFLKSQDLKRLRGDVGVPGLNREVVYNEIASFINDVRIQTSIASVLSAYDDLIEINEKRIKVLEEIAQLLYNEWFVKFKFPGHEKVKMVDSGTEYGNIPEGWEIKNVESLIKRIPVGKKYENKNVLKTGKVPVLDQGRSGFIGFHNDEPGVTASAENPVIVFANHTCYQNIIIYSFSAIQNVLPFIPNDGRDIFWLHWATKDLIKFNDYKGHWPEFITKKLIVPSVDATKRFGSLVGKYVTMMHELVTENNNLSKTRDLLIPQLVTGRRELK